MLICRNLALFFFNSCSTSSPSACLFSKSKIVVIVDSISLALSLVANIWLPPSEPITFALAPINVLNKSDSLSDCVFLFVAWAVWNCLNGPLADCPIVDMILLDGGLDTKSNPRLIKKSSLSLYVSFGLRDFDNSSADL